MRYGKFLQNGILMSDKPFEGSKPVNEAQPEELEGMQYVPTSWKETDTEIVREWILEPLPDEPTIEDKAEAYDILMGVSE